MDEMVGELERVLERPKFGLERDTIDAVTGMVRVLSDHVDHSRIRQVMREVKPLLPEKLDKGKSYPICGMEILLSSS